MNKRKEGQDASEKASLMEKMQPARRNYISLAVVVAKRCSQPWIKWFKSRSPMARLSMGATMLPMMLVPLFWGIFIVPLAFIVITLLYSMLFGFNTFVEHLEDALKQHCHVSQSVSVDRESRLSYL